MHTTDAIADLLTRVRNANSERRKFVEIPLSKMKKAIMQVLLDEGYIKKVNILRDGKQGVIRANLRYLNNKEPVIMGLKRVSKPGLRSYSGVEKMPRVMGGLGVAVISTSKGIMTDREARRKNVGGEVLAFVW
jgi:small subunit ribosomal protein S8